MLHGIILKGSMFSVVEKNCLSMKTHTTDPKHPNGLFVVVVLGILYFLGNLEEKKVCSLHMDSVDFPFVLK